MDRSSTQPVDLLFMVSAPFDAADSLDGARFDVFLRLHDPQERRQGDDFKRSWQCFLATANLLQFLPKFKMTSTEAVVQAAGGTELIPQAVSEGEGPAAEAGETEQLLEMLEITDESCHDLLRECAGRGLALPVIGFELAAADGSVVGEAELGWSDAQVAVLLEDQQEFRPVFEDAGWTVWMASDSNLPGELLKSLSE